MESLTDAMGSTRLSDEPEEPEQLLFNPSPNSGIDETILNNIPRYLFRLATPNSAGITNERWVCSESVRQDTPSSMEDVFFNMDNEKQIKVARILDSHLWWRQARNPDDNFVSWTSSLLFVLQYIYYRHYKDGTSLAEIKLYVVDTMKFPRGTFMRDLNLIDIFRDYNDGLENLWSLRNRPNLYFGEYLSQGSLMIENKCQAITAEVIFKQDRLRRIQPHFAELHHGKREDKPEWVREVNRLRNTIWPPPGSPLISPTELGDHLQAVQEILQHVSADWKCPVAIYFAALIGPEGVIRGQDTANDKVVGTDPRSVYLPHFELPDKIGPRDFEVFALDTTPELKQVKKLVLETYRYTVFQNLLDTEASNPNLHVESDSIGNQPASAAADSKRRQLAERIERDPSKVCLAVVRMLSQEVALATSSEDLF